MGVFFARCGEAEPHFPRVGRWLRCSCLFNRSLLSNAPKFPYSFVEGSPRLGALGLSDGTFTRPPKLFDGFDAPQRAGPRRADGSGAHQDVDRIGVELRKLPKRDPRALVELNFQ